MVSIDKNTESVRMEGAIVPARVPWSGRLRSGWRDHPERLWIVLILGLGLVLRIIGVGSRSYWNDEAYSVLLTENWKTVLLTGDLVSNHPPLFTLLATLWRALGLGETEGSMRLLTVLLGELSVLTVYLAARRLLDVRTALIAAFLVAISPQHVLHSQDLKEYMVLPVTAPLAVYSLFRATEENRGRLWFWYGLWAGIACYSDLYAGPLLVAINLWFVIQVRGRRDRIPGWLLGNLFGALLFLPQLHIMLGKTHTIMVKASEWWIPPPALIYGKNSVLFFLKTLAFGYWDLKPHFYIALGLYLMLAAAGVVLAWRRNWRVGLLLVFWFALSVAQVFAVSHAAQSIFLFRALIPYGLAFYILAAVAVASLNARTLRVGLLAGLAVIAAFALHQRYTDRYPPYEWPHRPGVHPPFQYAEATRFITERWRQGDVVVNASASTWIPLYWYGLRGQPLYWGAVSRAYIEEMHAGNLATTTREEFQTWHARHLQEIPTPGGRVWYVFSDWERLYFRDNASDAWRWLDSHYTETLHQAFQGIEVFLYVREEDGRPIQAVERTEDNGAEARLTYAVGAETRPYTKVTPDRGVSPRPLEARVGDLLLRFDESPASSTGDLSTGADTRVVKFSLANRSNRAAEVLLECLPSDVLLEVPALYEAGPAPGFWNTMAAHNPGPPPPNYDITAAVARLRDAPTPILGGTVDLPGGVYDTLLYVLGCPGDGSHSRAGVVLDMAGMNVIAPAAPKSQGPLRWNWLAGRRLTLRDSVEPIPVRLSAIPLPGVPESWADVSYLALRRVRPGSPPVAAGDAVNLWPGLVRVAPNSKQYWSAKIDGDTGRVDVWAYQAGENGLAYHIFRTFRPESLLRPEPLATTQ